MAQGCTFLALQKGMFDMGDFIGSFWFFAIGVIVLIGLVVLLLVLRNKREEE